MLEWSVEIRRPTSDLSMNSLWWMSETCALIRSLSAYSAWIKRPLAQCRPPASADAHTHTHTCSLPLSVGGPCAAAGRAAVCQRFNRHRKHQNVKSHHRVDWWRRVSVLWTHVRSKPVYWNLWGKEWRTFIFMSTRSTRWGGTVGQWSAVLSHREKVPGLIPVIVCRNSTIGEY